jgi:hypothetical protein
MLFKYMSIKVIKQKILLKCMGAGSVLLEERKAFGSLKLRLETTKEKHCWILSHEI